MKEKRPSKGEGRKDKNVVVGRRSAVVVFVGRRKDVFVLLRRKAGGNRREGEI
jgi:hypothetical protein